MSRHEFSNEQKTQNRHGTNQHKQAYPQIIFGALHTNSFWLSDR